MSPTSDLLAGLRDIHLPAPVSLWPPAPGWSLALVLIVLVAALLWVRRRRRSLRRVALAELDALRFRYAASPDAAALARSLSALVRRVALARFGAQRVASLRGDSWYRFLAESGGQRGFTTALAGSLSEALYRPPADDRREEASAWVTAACGWIRENT